MKRTAIPQGDIRVEYHGAVGLLVPLTKLGRDWVERNLDHGSVQPFYQRGRVIVMERRYVTEIVADIHRDRLVTR